MGLFHSLILSMSNSKHCPYAPKDLWDMPVDELFSLREIVFFHEALDYAVRKDQQDRAERQTR